MNLKSIFKPGDEVIISDSPVTSAYGAVHGGKEAIVRSIALDGMVNVYLDGYIYQFHWSLLAHNKNHYLNEFAKCLK